MQIREFVELAGDATEIAGVCLIVAGLLIAADIVRTVAFTPTMESLAALALIVAIRTFLSWSLALELEGRWPWQPAAEPVSQHT